MRGYATVGQYWQRVCLAWGSTTSEGCLLRGPPPATRVHCNGAMFSHQPHLQRSTALRAHPPPSPPCLMPCCLFFIVNVACSTRCVSDNGCTPPPRKRRGMGSSIMALVTSLSRGNPRPGGLSGDRGRAGGGEAYQQQDHLSQLSSRS